jgi:transcriptional regulator with AAA-type ATPase domain/tetratricopeptide (TPR) repeat protein
MPSVDVLAELLGESPGIVEVRNQIRRLLPRLSGAGRQPAVLILGETGTGKTLVARLIHRAVARRGNCVDINCAAFPETLLEAELFGYEAGAFTDARRAKPGLIQEADGGTLFLDEVSLLPPALQAKLLKVLDERRVRRLGSTRSEPVNVLVISATNEDLEAAVLSGRFREDLYHRLAVLPITLPPLRVRGADILLLADHFLARVCAEYGLAPKTFTSDAREAILAHPWRGNVRELGNVIERAALSTEVDALTAALLHLSPPPRARPAPAGPRAVPRVDLPESEERLLLLQALSQTDWNVSRAAHRLGISRNTIRYRIDKYSLRRGMTLGAPAVPPAPTPAVPAAAARAEPTGRPVVRWDHRRVTYLIARIQDAGGSLSARSSQALEFLIEKARSFGGRVTDLGPAGLTAIFGLEPVEDAPLRAANAALAMRRASERGEWPPAVSVRMGIHVAEAMVGSFSGTMEIDEAAKRAAVAVVDGGFERVDPDTIFVSDAAAPFLERRCDLVAEGPLFRLLSCRIDGRVFGKRMTTHVGRTRQLDLLRLALESAKRGDGQVVGLTGEAGIGKSRLLFEFQQTLAGEPVTYAEGTCLSYGQAISYLPVVEIVRALLPTPGGPADAAAAVEATLGDLGVPSETAPVLLQLLGLDPDGTPLDLPSDAVKARIFDAVTQVILELSQRRPIVLAVEDVHWSDPTSEEYFTSLVERVGGARILMIFTYRPGYRAPWIGRDFAMQIPLQALSPDESAALLQSILPAADVARALIDAVIAKAEGNPFFLEELSHALELAQPSAVLSKVPDTVEEMLRARIDRLPERERRVLQAAALVGRQVPLSLLSALVDLEAPELRQALGQLVAAEFLRESPAGPDPEYRFKQTLTYETAYQTLERADRLRLHRRALEALEKAAAGRLPEPVEHLAHHALRGEVWDRAVTCCARAGVKAAGRSANREAVDYLDQALEALRHLPDGPEATEQAIDLRLRLRNSLWALGALDRVLTVLREAQALAAGRGDRREAMVASYLTHYFWAVAEHDQGMAIGARALELAALLGDPQLEAETAFYLGLVHLSLGRYREAAEMLGRSIDAPPAPHRLARQGQPISVSVARAYLARCLAELGDFAAGIARASEALALAEGIGHPFAVVGSRFGLGCVHLRKGDFPRAIAAVEPALELLGGRHLENWYPAVAATLGAAYALSGRADEGVLLLERAVSRAASMGIRASHSLWLAYLGQAQLLAGHPDEARRSARTALEAARARGERGYEGWALRVLGEIAARGADPDLQGAAAHFGTAIAIADELGMRPLLALSHRGLGRALERSGDSSGAARHLGIATALLRELDMATWPPPGPMAG